MLPCRLGNWGRGPTTPVCSACWAPARPVESRTTGRRKRRCPLRKATQASELYQWSRLFFIAFRPAGGGLYHQTWSRLLFSQQPPSSLPRNKMWPITNLGAMCSKTAGSPLSVGVDRTKRRVLSFPAQGSSAQLVCSEPLQLWPDALRFRAVILRCIWWSTSLLCFLFCF